MPDLEIRTTRFGPVQIEPDDVICFPNGMLGLDGCRHWVLLADAHNDALGWLQSTTQPEVALAVVSPRRFVPDYQVRTPRAEIAPLSLDPLQDAHVLAIVSKNEESITLNLKAPLIINLERRVGRQVINSGEQPVQYELCEQLPRKKIA
jgi:flagellar assembly factor FliW